MTIYGKEVGFAFTVGASKALADLCPGKDLGRLGEASGKTYADRMAFTENLILILNKAYCDTKAIEGETVEPVTLEMLDSLTPQKLMELGTEAMASFQKDSQGEIEVEGKKGQGVE